MPKFEYAEIEMSVGGSVGPTTKCRVTVFHSDKHEFLEGEFGKVMAEMGEKGWELVSTTVRQVAGMGITYRLDYIFKRPKA